MTDLSGTPAIPAGFLTSDEHPLLAVPFAAEVDGVACDGERVSLVEMIVRPDAPLEPGRRWIARLHFTFRGFELTLAPEVVVRESGADGRARLEFADPTGPHLPQLRYVINGVIAGEMATVDGLLAYTGPTKPPKPEGARAQGPRPLVQRLRSAVTMAISAMAIGLAGWTLYVRSTTAVELYPVLVEQEGRTLRATAGGQLAVLAPRAAAGEVAFAIASNAGDLLSFQMPCDCGVRLAPGIFEGATLLPADPIMTIFDDSPEPRAHTLMSIEGLSRAMTGDRVEILTNDGRVVPVDVVITGTRAPGELAEGAFVPVELRAPEGALTSDDIGTAGRLRLSTPLLGGLLPEL